MAAPAFAAVNLTLAQGPGGVAIANPTLFGNVNGLGIGNFAGTGLTPIASGTSGYLYATPINLTVTLTGPDKSSNVNISAQVTSNFGSTRESALVCLPGACSSSASFSPILTTGGTAVINQTLLNNANGNTMTFTPNIAIFISNANGSPAPVTTADQVTITFTASRVGGANTGVVALTISDTQQTALSLQLATGSAGPGTPCTVGAGAGTDFSINFGNVNGLGVGTPTCGGVVATTASAATYATSYQLTPSYADFSSTTATVSLTSSGFVNSTTLTLLEGSAATTASLTTIPVSGTGHSIAVTSSGTAIGRFLGIKVASTNGSGSFPGTAGASGSDSATLTFTMTVP